jgi:predicted nucleotidyltransferase
MKDRLASVIDQPRKTLSPWIWDASVNPPKIKDEIRKTILDDLYSALEFKLIEPKKWISEVTLTGSSVTNQYLEDTDIDVNVSVNYDLFRALHSFLEFKSDLETRTYIRNIVYKLNKKIISGSHLIRYFVIGKDRRLESDFVFDLLKDEWIKPPVLVSLDFHPDDVFKEQKIAAIEMVNSISKIYTNIKIRIEDFRRCQQSINRDFSKEEVTKDKIREMILILQQAEDDIKDCRIKSFNLKSDSLAYNFSNSWQENNVIFKYVEKYGYNKPLTKLTSELSDVDKQFLLKNNIVF